MSDVLLDRLQVAVERLLEQNQALTRQCQQLKAEKLVWQDEKAVLLEDVEQALTRFERLDLEGL